MENFLPSLGSAVIPPARVFVSAVRSRVFASLFLADLAFLGLHLLSLSAGEGSALAGNNLTRIDRENSMSELFEHAKLGVASILLIYSATRGGGRSLFLLASVLAILMLDNALGLHELAGAWLMPDHQHTGEGLYLFGFGGVLLGVLLISDRLAPPAQSVNVRAVGLALAVFGFFAFGVDGLHFISRWYMPEAYDIFSTVEDGGELISLSLVVAVCARMLSEKYKRQVAL